MADIVDPVVIKFTNEIIRPLSERIRDLKVYLDEAKAEYDLNIAGVLSGNVNADLVQDNRAAEGINQFTKKDLVDMLVLANGLITDLDVAGEMDKVRFGTVRPFRG